MSTSATVLTSATGALERSCRLGGSTQSQPSRTKASVRGSFSNMNYYFDYLHTFDNGNCQHTGACHCLGPCAIDKLCLDCHAASKPLSKLVLMWRLGAVRKDLIDRAAWVLMMHAHNIANPDQLSMKLARWTEQVEADEKSFTCMYNFLYDYLRGEVKRQMTTRTAIEAWTVLFPNDTRWSMWRRWVSTEYDAKYIPRDLWQQMRLYITFSRAHTQKVRVSSTMKVAANAFADNEHSAPATLYMAWPMAIKAFVEWERAAQANAIDTEQVAQS